jgi:hypothetical protein
VLSVCVRTFIEIDHDGTRNVIGVQYATPRPWHVLILWSLDQVIPHPSHLIILVLHIHIIICMQVPYQFLEPIAPNPQIYSCKLSPIIPSVISSLFYTSSCLGFIFKSMKGSPEIFGKIFHVQLTQVYPKFKPISVRNLPLNSMK